MFGNEISSSPEYRARSLLSDQFVIGMFNRVIARQVLISIFRIERYG